MAKVVGLTESVETGSWSAAATDIRFSHSLVSLQHWLRQDSRINRLFHQSIFDYDLLDLLADRGDRCAVCLVALL